MLTKINWPTAIVLSAGLVVWGSLTVLGALGHPVPSTVTGPLAIVGMVVTSQMEKLFNPKAGDS